MSEQEPGDMDLECISVGSHTVAQGHTGVPATWN